MQIDVVSREELEKFEQRLIENIKKLLSQNNRPAMGRWLRSEDVRRMLKLSPGTLYTLRKNGTLPFVKIGSLFFYEYEDIERMMKEQKRNPYVFTPSRNPWNKV